MEEPHWLWLKRWEVLPHHTVSIESRTTLWGQEINANHIRPVRTGFVYATATPLHLGKSSQVWDIKVRNEEGKLTCVSRFTVAVLKKAQLPR